MVRYDAKVIEKFAIKLYSQADRIVAFYCVLFSLVGGAAGAALGGRGDRAPFIVLGLLLGGGLGYVIGEARAFMLRLQAQVALCQVEIERNTRNANPTAIHDPHVSVPLLVPIANRRWGTSLAGPDRPEPPGGAPPASATQLPEEVL